MELDNIEDGYVSSEDDGHDDSDRELQVAFERGFLKKGINIAIPARRPPINNQAGLLSKLTHLKTAYPNEWIERMDSTVSRPNVSKEAVVSLLPGISDSGGAPKTKKLKKEVEENDFQREISFYKQAQLTLEECLPRLHKLGVCTRRPDDYFAEMAKSDQHMTRVRERLAATKAIKERSMAARRLRLEKKFAAKVQKEVMVERQSEKRKLEKVIKKGRKGKQAQIDQLLDEHRTYHDDDDENAAMPSTSHQSTMKRSFPLKKSSSKMRQFKDKKYGFGGKKSGKKRNTRESHEDYGANKKSKNAGRGSQSRPKKPMARKRRRNR